MGQISVEIRRHSGSIPYGSQQRVNFEAFHRPVDICKIDIVHGENRLSWSAHPRVGRRAAENRREPAVRGSENAREAARQPGGAFALRKALPGFVAGRWSTTATGRLLDSHVHMMAWPSIAPLALGGAHFSASDGKWRRLTGPGITPYAGSFEKQTSRGILGNLRRSILTLS